MTTRRRYVARGVPGGWRIWNRKTRDWWGDLYEVAPDELLEELNGDYRPDRITELLSHLRRATRWRMSAATERMTLPCGARQSVRVTPPTSRSESMARVIRDVLATTHLNVVGRIEADDGEGNWTAWLEHDGTGTGISPGEDSPDEPEYLAYLFADMVQEEIEETLREPWPKCPHHRHALSPDVARQHAVWCCSEHNPPWERPIGELGASDVGSWGWPKPTE